MNPLLKKAIIQNIRLPVLMALPLFIAAGDFHFPRLWNYIAAITAFSILTTGYLYFCKPDLLERRLNGMKGEKEEAQKKVRRAMSLLLVALLVVSGLDNRYVASQVSTEAVAAAYAFILIGFTGYFLTVRENAFASSVVEVEKDQQVITTGPYRLIRHPMYTALSLIFIGTPIALGSWWGLIIVAPLIATLIVRLKDEEKQLRADLPGYTEYCGQTRRKLVPFVW